MFLVQSENITCHWEFSAHHAGLRLVQIKEKDIVIFLPRGIYDNVFCLTCSILGGT
jgi:hypothetical protein